MASSGILSILYNATLSRLSANGEPPAGGGGLCLKDLIAKAPEAILVHDQAGRLTEVNEALCLCLGYAEDELLSMRLADVQQLHGPDDTTPLTPGAKLRTQGLFCRKDGTTFPVEISSVMLSDQGGGVVVAMARDISDWVNQQKDLERAFEQLYQANTKAEDAITKKNRFLESVGYRLRTPLNTVLGLSEMIGAGVCGTVENPKITEYLGDIHASGMELLRVIDDLSGVTSIEAAISGDLRSYRAIIEMSPDAIFLCRDGVMEFLNSTGVRLLGGFSAEQFVGHPFEEYVHPDYRMLMEENFAPLVGEQSTTPMKFLHPSGKVLDVAVSAAASPEEDGTVLVVARNISDVVRATRDVAAQAKRLNSILDTAVDAVVVCNETGVIETFNRAAEAMFGIPSREAVGQNVTILMTQADALGHPEILRGVGTRKEAKVLGVAREVIARRHDGTPFPAEISLSVCHLDDRRLFTAMIRDVTERRTFENHLAHSATHDALTGLPNRRLLQDKLQQAIERAKVDGTWVAVWFVDLDGFKAVNDVMGHSAGDELLVEAGRRMVASVKSTDTVARFGGDEFALVLSGLRNQRDVIGGVERFISQVACSYVLRGRDVTLNANIGIALYPAHAAMASDLVVHAGAAMIVAKATGRNLYRFYDPSMQHQSAERLTLETELRRGIERGELLLHYQPQVDVKTGVILGLEALVRWNHPVMGMISPGRFIPVAEQTGLIVPLGEWVLRQACIDLRRLEDMGVNNVSVAVNISPRQFSDSDVLGLITGVIAETGIDPAHLDVEITEGTLMQDPEHVLDYLEQLKALGLQLSIDDFGTGYSSLNYLKRFPVDTLKIDRSFVIEIAESPKDEAIAVTIITLAHAMGMTALAEGVEYEAQSKLLERLGCDVIQGFLYSKPQPFEIVARQLRDGVTLPVAAVPAL